VSWQWTRDPRRQRVALYYGIAGAITGSLAVGIGATGLVLLWPTLSLLLVAGIYAGIGPDGFGKGSDGRMNAVVRWLLAPYIFGARVNSRLWTFHGPNLVRVSHHVWVGRFPSVQDLQTRGIRSVVDLTAELPARAPAETWRCIPMLDLVTPPVESLREAADEIELRQKSGPVLVCCALGYGRSAAAVVTWLLRTHRAATIDQAVARLLYVRPQAVLHASDLAAIGLAASDAAAPVEGLARNKVPAARLLPTSSLTD